MSVMPVLCICIVGYMCAMHMYVLIYKLRASRAALLAWPAGAKPESIAIRGSAESPRVLSDCADASQTVSDLS